jgi:sugar phosphate isomerase/epimerase
VRRVGEFLNERDIRVSVNGPIFDLNPGSLDEFVREHTKKVFLRTIELAAAIGSSRVILPTGFSPYLSEDARAGWKSLAGEVWEACLNRAGEMDITICLENRYEDTPDPLTSIINERDNRLLGVCLDVGHVNVFSKKNISHWIKSIGSHVKEIHLNDNDGKTDDHLTLGEGTIDIPALFRLFHKYKLWPPMIFDMSLEQAAQSFKYLGNKGIFSFQPELL